MFHEAGMLRNKWNDVLFEAGMLRINEMKRICSTSGSAQGAILGSEGLQAQNYHTSTALLYKDQITIQGWNYNTMLELLYNAGIIKVSKEYPSFWSIQEFRQNARVPKEESTFNIIVYFQQNSKVSTE